MNKGRWEASTVLLNSIASSEGCFRAKSKWRTVMSVMKASIKSAGGKVTNKWFGKSRGAAANEISSLRNSMRTSTSELSLKEWEKERQMSEWGTEGRPEWCSNPKRATNSNWSSGESEWSISGLIARPDGISIVQRTVLRGSQKWEKCEGSEAEIGWRKRKQKKCASLPNGARWPPQFPDTIAALGVPRPERRLHPWMTCSGTE